MFNQRIISSLDQHNLIPMEIVGGRKVHAKMKVAINKKLIVNIYNKFKAKSVVISSHATNYYDRMDHPFTSLTEQDFSVHKYYILVLLKAIQSMRIFLQTYSRTSSTFYSGIAYFRFQGSC